MTLDVILDTAYDAIMEGSTTAACAELIEALREFRLSLGPEEWKRIIESQCLQHPIRELLHEDPYTRRAFGKPRGYAGDAVMLDYVYTRQPPAGTSDRGCEVFSITTGFSNGDSVRERRNLIARLIDETAEETPMPRIVSLACGHLREAEDSSRLANGLIGELIALDQDRESLEVVAKDYGTSSVVQCINAPVSAVARGHCSFSNIDFVYAAGLLDYLSDALARRLAARMFSMLRSDGRLLLANFLPTSHGRGYMEAFMDWHLVYRDEAQMKAIASGCAPSEVKESSVWRDQLENVVYVMLRRR